MSSTLRNGMSLAAILGFFKSCALAAAQDALAAAAPDHYNTNAAALKKPLNLVLQWGPLTLHPRISTGVTADDNILFSASHPQSDLYWIIQPGFQAVVGDDAALVALRDQHGDPLSLTPGSLIVQPPENWTGKIMLLDYAPRFKFFDQNTAQNAIDEFATFNVLWPMSRLILGFRQGYQLEKANIIEAGQYATTETIPTTLSAAYQWGEKTSIESNFRRLGVVYDQSGLTGYTEYNTEDWLNYELTESMPLSVGVLAGYDDVAKHQSQSYEQLRARVRYLYTEKLTFDASFGGELRQYENGQSDTFSPVFSLSAAYRPAERTTVSLTGYRQQNASILNGYNYTSTGATLGLTQGITDRFMASVSAGYYWLDYTPVIGTLSNYSDDYYTFRFSLDAKLLQHLNGQLFYQLLSRQSPASGDASENQLGVNVTWSY